MTSLLSDGLGLPAQKAIDMITFTVTGTAVPKQRPRISGRRAYTPKRTKDYEGRVLEAFRSSYQGFYPAFGKDMPVRICITVSQEIPRSWSKKKRARAESGEIVPLSRNGDIDNIAKSILDALNGFAYEDDCQVTTLIITKQYGAEPCAKVQLGEDKQQK